MMLLIRSSIVRVRHDADGEPAAIRRGQGFSMEINSFKYFTYIRSHGCVAQVRHEIGDRAANVARDEFDDLCRLLGVASHIEPAVQKQRGDVRAVEQVLHVIAAAESSSTLACNSAFTVCSSSFSDCISSLEVVSSSVGGLKPLICGIAVPHRRSGSPPARFASPHAWPVLQLVPTAAPVSASVKRAFLVGALKAFAGNIRASRRSKDDHDQALERPSFIKLLDADIHMLRSTVGLPFF